MATVTLTVPALCTGLVAVILVGLTTATRVAALAPNRTLAPRTKSAPMMVTTVPPDVGPRRSETEITLGARYPKRSALVARLVPLVVVTVTLTVPALCAGLVAVILVGLVTWTVAALEVPKLTDDVPVKLVPVMTTIVPPAVSPVLRLSDLTVGSGVEYVNWPTFAGALVPPEVVTVT